MANVNNNPNFSVVPFRSQQSKQDPAKNRLILAPQHQGVSRAGRDLLSSVSHAPVLQTELADLSGGLKSVRDIAISTSPRVERSPPSHLV